MEFSHHHLLSRAAVRFAADIEELQAQQSPHHANRHRVGRLHLLLISEDQDAGLHLHHMLCRISEHSLPTVRNRQTPHMACQTPICQSRHTRCRLFLLLHVSSQLPELLQDHPSVNLRKRSAEQADLSPMERKTTRKLLYFQRQESFAKIRRLHLLYRSHVLQ